MEDLLGIILFRSFSRFIGQNARYGYYKMIGKKRSMKSLSNVSKNEYKDLGKALRQDFLNRVVGGIIVVFFILVVVMIVFS